MIRTKDDVETHGIGYHGRSLPAVNVKIYGSLSRVPLPLELGMWSDDGGTTWNVDRSHKDFTADWIEQHLTDSEVWGWQEFAAESGWEFIRSEAEEIFGSGVKVWSEGRSGGWAVVEGLDEIESWDAVLLAKWRKFAKTCRAAADDIPRSTLELIYINIYQPALEADEALETVLDWRKGVSLVAEAAILHDDEED